MMKRIIAAIAAVAAVASGAAAQLPRLSWRNVAIGTPSAVVLTFHQDEQGLMWLGTSSGLYSYDGYSTRPAPGEAYMPGPQVYGIAQRGDTLFLGSNNGLFLYDKARGGYGRAAGGDFPAEMRALLLVGRTLWIGSLYGLYRYDTATGALQRPRLALPHQAVYALLHDPAGQALYIGTYNGLCRLNLADGTLTSVSLHGHGTTRGNTFVNAVAADPRRGCLLVGTEASLLRYYPSDGSVEELTALHGNSVKSIVVAPDGSVVAGTDNGVLLVDGDDPAGERAGEYRHDSRDDRSLANNVAWALHADRHGNIWAGTEMGISIADGESLIKVVRLSDITHRGDGHQIYKLLRDRQGNLWMGGTNGIIRAGAAGTAPDWHMHGDPAHPLSHSRVRDVYETSGGEVWIATDGGINRYEPARRQFVNYDIADSTGRRNANWAYSIVEQGGMLWTGSYLGGVMAVDHRRLVDAAAATTVTADRAVNADCGLRNDFINQLIVDHEGNKWVLLFRDEALTRIDGATGQVTRHDVLDAAGGYPAFILCDAAGRIWCGFNEGVARLAPDGAVERVARFPFKRSSGSILAMAETPAGIWASTTYGTWAVDTATLATRLLPLPEKPYTAIYTDPASGKVLLGAIDEYVEADPELMSGLQVSDSVAITHITLGDAPLDATFTQINSWRQVHCSYDRNSIALELSTLNYTPDTFCQFAYRVAAGNATPGEWTLLPIGSNTVKLAGLGVGRHTVEMQLAGVGSSVRRLTVVVDPPWFLSWWALAAYAVAAVAAVAAAVAYVRRRSMRRLRRMERESALAAVESRINFLTDIAHELKTPLSMIVGPASKLRAKASDPAMKRTLATIYDNALKLNALVHQAVEINQMQTIADDLLIYSDIDAVDFCRSIFQAYRDNHPERHFVFTAAQAAAAAHVDAVKLESVLNNLLSNACKYTDPGATISCSIATVAGRSLVIMVSDDGPGIAPEEQSLIFQRMFRSPRTAAQREGTGIGLYLAKQYVEMHGGTIEVRSREGEGATFVITLPLSSDKSGKSDKSDLSDLSDKSDKSDLSDRSDRSDRSDKSDKSDRSDRPDRPRVLIVDDNAAIAAFIKEVLADSYCCVTAHNGKAGLAVASTFHPDLIIADEMMPVMTGLEMCRRIKSSPYLSAVPIILLTAKVDGALETQSVRQGIDAFMAKPFDAPLLLARVEQLLAAKEAMRRAARLESLTTPAPVKAESASERQLAEVTAIIEAHISDPDLSVARLCQASGMQPKQLYRLVKNYVGLSPVDYIRQTRLRRAAMLLEQRKFTVAEVMYMVGFSSSSYFSRCFQAHYGCKPSQYPANSDGPGGTA